MCASLCVMQGSKYHLGDTKRQYVECVSGIFNPDRAAGRALTAFSAPLRGVKLQVRCHSSRLPLSLQPVPEAWVQVLCAARGSKIGKGTFSFALSIFCSQH